MKTTESMLLVLEQPNGKYSLYISTGDDSVLVAEDMIYGEAHKQGKKLQATGLFGSLQDAPSEED